MNQAGVFSRRQVLGTGLGAASAVLAVPGASRAGEAGDDLRCGMIGTGGRGQGVLMAIHKCPGVRVTALCDIHAGRLNLAVTRVPGDRPKLFSDYRELIDYPELDAIFVETPCYLHAEMAVAVMQSGRHCYCEKPMAITVRDVQRVYDTARRAKALFQVGTQLRYASPWYSSIMAIRSGEFGKPVLIRAHRHNQYDLPRGLLWYFRRDLCGDTIVEQAVHEFDLFNWIFGGPPVRASGYGGQAIRHEPEMRDIMDHYVLSLDYGPNQAVSYSHSWIEAPKTSFGGRQEVVLCERASIDIEHGRIFPMEGDVSSVDPDPAGDSTELAVRDFFRCIREDDKVLADAEAGRNGALVALLGQRSIDEGRTVTLDELLAGA